MGTKTATRFYVELGGVKRQLLSVRERKNGDLIISLDHATHIAACGVPDGQPIGRQRHSVHRTPNSPDVSAIKMTLAIQGGEDVETVHEA